MRTKLKTVSSKKQPLTDRDYIESCFCIVNKQSKKVPFLLNDVQVGIEEKLREKNIIVKARKQGVSSYVLSKFAVACIVDNNTKAVVISHEREATKRLLGRVYYFLNNLPAKPILERASAQEIKFVETDSTYWIGTAGSKAFGRGDDITHLHISELDWWENPDMLTGLLEAVVPGGIIIIETTGNGYGSKTHQMWEKAVEGKSSYIPIFIPWFASREYQSTLPPDFEPTQEESILQKRFNLNDNQIAWRRQKIGDMDIPELFPQEYPATPEEAFSHTDTTRFIIPIDIVLQNVANQQHNLTIIKKITICDIADEGDDETVIYDMENTKIDEDTQEIYRHHDTMDTVGRIMAHAKRNGSNLICIDKIGVGKGAYDILCQTFENDENMEVYGFDSRVKANDQETYFNKNAESWFELRGKMVARLCDIPKDPILIKQLSRVTFHYMANGKLAIDSRKELLKRLGCSPDRAKTYVMAIDALERAEPVKKKDPYKVIDEDSEDYDLNPQTV